MLTADQGAFLSPNSGSVGQDAARNRTKRRLRPRWLWASRGRVEHMEKHPASPGGRKSDELQVIDGITWIGGARPLKAKARLLRGVPPKPKVRKPRKQHLCPDCKRVIRWRKEHDEWIALDLSGGDHAKYCEPPRWEPLGPPRTWQGGKR